ncbi:MAG: hypothetical protein ACC618_02850 [Patescibacteria group bacterium]
MSNRRLHGTGGQALIIVLLAMVVVLTIVLSVVSRSVTDISVTTFGEEAQRAFDAAEAGIEEVLLRGYAPGGDVIIGDATYNVASTNPIPDPDEFVYPSELFSGESATFWFVSHDSSGNLICGGEPCLRANSINKICWGEEGTDPDTDTTPAIELAVFYDLNQTGVTTGDFSGLRIAKITFDPNTSRTSDNKFNSVTGTCSGGIAGKNFAFSTGNIQLGSSGLGIPPGGSCLELDGCLIIAKVRIFYNYDVLLNKDIPHPIAIEVNSTGPPTSRLPAQGTQIDSTGVAGASTRRINVFQGFTELPFVFDAAVFGLTDLGKP